MPMFQPPNIAGVVLDLDTAVKDGVLGGAGGYVAGFVKENEKLDLKKMIQELNSVEIPSVFICPISLDPMQEPVTLCTGQTYEKSNILKWLTLGHYTCPTTMQELWDDTITPNTTLAHLIHTWFSQKYVQMKKRAEDAQGMVSHLITTLRNKAKGETRLQALKELHRLVAAHSTARKLAVDEGIVPLLSFLLGPFTSYAVGSQVIAILVNLHLNSESKANLMQPAKVSSVVDILNEGSLETKLNCVKLIEMLMSGDDFRAEMISSHSLLVALMRLVRDRRHPSGQSAALGLLKLISTHNEVARLMVNINSVPQLVELMPVLNPECVELAVSVLDMLSCSVAEGRQALKDCPNAVPHVVKLLMRISEKCTENGLSILWCMCKHSEECSLIAVDAGVAAKLLLVIQSGCGPTLKQRAAELLKLCSLSYSDTMFISKCKLTRTIQ